MTDAERLLAIVEIQQLAHRYAVKVKLAPATTDTLAFTT